MNKKRFLFYIKYTLIYRILILIAAFRNNPLHGSTCSADLKQSTTKKHILISCLTSNKGGIYAHCFALYNLLDTLGLNPIIMIHNLAPEARTYAQNIKALYIEYKLPEQIENPVSMFKEFQTFKDPDYLAFLQQACQQYNVSLIHANFPWELSGLRILKKNFPLKVIYTIHDEHPIWQKNLAVCDGIMCASSIVTDILKKRYTHNPLLLLHAHPVFDEKPYLSFKSKTTQQEFFKNNFNINTKGRLVCTIVSNYYGCKNHAVAIEAFDLLIKQQNIPACLILAGSGPTQKKCSRLIKKLGLNDHVHILGYVHDIKSLMHYSDIIINSSINDSFPITLLEAAALSKPIIATRGTGSNSLVQDGKTGLLFNCYEPSELVDCILQYAHNPWLREKLARQCHEFLLNNFTYQHNVKNLLAMYNFLGVSTNHPLTSSNNILQS